ncbi:MAG: ATPase, T2SS/T4P/T4SS family [Verrucomicrobiota bacterium]
MTGHLVMSTLHTNSAIGSIARLIDRNRPAFIKEKVLQLSETSL